MKDGERRRALLEGVTTGRDVHELVKRGNYGRLIEAQPGLTAAAYDADLVAHTSSSDPTGTAVTQRPDRTVNALHNLDRALAAWVTAGETVRRILAGYDPPRTANRDDQRHLVDANTKATPGCEHCATITEPHGDIPFHCPPDPRRKGPTTVNWRLPDKKLLCSWCIGHVQVNGVLPDEDELLRHRDKGDVVRERVDPKAPRRSA